jgi:hypothetical protein
MPKSLALGQLPNGHEDELPKEGSYEWYLQQAKRAEAAVFLQGRALREIRERELYRAKYADFDSFCRVELHNTRNSADRLIRSADIIYDLMVAGVTELPHSERSVRPLGLLRNPHERVAAWKLAVSQKAKGLPTAKDVSRAVAQIRPRSKKKPDRRDHDYRCLLNQVLKYTRLAHQHFFTAEFQDWIGGAEKRKLENLQRQVREIAKRIGEQILEIFKS